MLTELKAYSSWLSAPTLSLDPEGRPETDLIQILDVDGLDPVKATVTTSPFGSIDGAAYTGGNVLSRNIVLTLRPNPDWDLWTYESLRKLVYNYFMPKRPVRLVFESTHLPPVEIYGVVESSEANAFTKDPEYKISIICPDPYFTTVDPVVISGQSIRAGGAVTPVEYEGNIQAGIRVKVSWSSDPSPTVIGIQIGSPAVSYFTVDATVNSGMYFEANTVPMQKYIQNVSIGTGVITNLLSKAHVQEGSLWPMFEPGENDFSVITDQGVQDWELSYFARFAGL